VRFCDLANSTPLAERLGPEAMHTLLNQFFELALAEVHRYEGTINQFLGDGFMALFGVPLAVEDHARRALLAALGIQQGMRELRADVAPPAEVELAVRMGLNTGLVVVGWIGDNLRMDYTAVGDTTNLAARMQQMAPAGAILVAEATYRAAREVFEWRATGPLAVKGKAELVPIYALLGARAVTSRFEVLAQRGLTQFVGRYPELQQLLTAWEQAEQGDGRVVSVVGEAGIGKSRLVYEFKQWLTQEDTPYVEGSCFAYGDSISYLPFLAIVKDVCGVEGAASEAEAKGRLAHALTTLSLDPAAVAPYLHNLLAFAVEDALFARLTPELIRRRTVEALKTLLLAAATRHPFVLILEDVHWIDKASEEVLTTVVEAMGGVPLLLALVYRPEYLHAWANEAYHAQIALTRLPGASIAVLRAIKAENELALAYAGYGRLHRQQGHIAPARDYLTRALAIFERLGTLGEPDRVRQVLAELPEG